MIATTKPWSKKVDEKIGPGSLLFSLLSIWNVLESIFCGTEKYLLSNAFLGLTKAKEQNCILPAAYCTAGALYFWLNAPCTTKLLRCRFPRLFHG